MKRRKRYSPPPRRANWKSRLGWVLGTALVVTVSLAVRYCMNASPATAESGAAPGATEPRTAPGAAVREATSTQPGASTRPSQPDIRTLKTMAVVNGEEITREQLAQQCLLRYGEERLESLVNKQIILQACQERGVTITNGDVDDEIARMAQGFNVPVDQWYTILQNERGITPDEYRREIVWPMLALRRLAAVDIQVTQEEYDEAFERELGPSVQVRIIVASTPETIQQLHEQALTNPDEFGDLAKQYSEDAPSAAQRGIIPPIRHHMGDPAVEEAAFALQPGEISPVLHTGGQYLFMQCDRLIEAQYVAPEFQQEVRSRLMSELRQDKSRELAAKIFDELEAQANLQLVLGNPELRQQMPGVAAVVSGQSISTAQLAEECLLRHGVEVLDGEIHRLILMQALRRQGLAVTEEGINEEIGRAALSYGYVNSDGSPNIAGWLKHVTSSEGATVELYVRDAVWPTVALKLLVGQNVEVTEEDLQKGFVANYGERVEVQAIVLQSQRQATSVWEMARQNNNEEYFGDLATEYSVEPMSQANSGHVPPIRQFGGRPQLEDEAFQLSPGEISGVINVGDQWVILRCLGRTEPVVEDLEDVRGELTKDILEKKMRAAMANIFEQLLRRSQIDNFLAGTSQSPRRLRQAEASGSLSPGVVPATATVPLPTPPTR